MSKCLLRILNIDFEAQVLGLWHFIDKLKIILIFVKLER